MQWVVEVPGLPRPKGSWKCVGRNGRHQLVEQVPSGDWRERVTDGGARLAGQIGAPITGPVRVRVTFTVPLPKSIRPQDRTWPAVANGVGDIDKLARCILDCFTRARVWRDDGQVVTLLAIKAYPHSPARDVLTAPGALIRLSSLDPEMDTLL